METGTFNIAELINVVVGATIALAGFLTAGALIIKYSKSFGNFIERWMHSGCRNDSTMCVMLGNSIVHRCEIAAVNKCLPQEERDWLIKLMTEYETNRHWNGVVKDRYEKTIKLPLTCSILDTQTRLDTEAAVGRHIT